MTDSPRNGDQLRQDVEIRALREAVEKNRDKLDEHRAMNEVQHQDMDEHVEGIYHRLASKIDTMGEKVGELMGERKARWFLVSIVAAIASAVLGGGAASIAWGIDRIDSGDAENSARIEAVQQHINRVEKEERGNAREGFQLAKDLRRDVDKNEENIDELRKLHRLPRETNRIGPGKE